MAVARMIFEDDGENVRITGWNYMVDKPTPAQSCVAQLLAQFRHEISEAKKAKYVINNPEFKPREEQK